MAPPLARQMSLKAPDKLSLKQVDLKTLSIGQTVVFNQTKLHGQSEWLKGQFEGLGTHWFNILVVPNGSTEIKQTSNLEELKTMAPFQPTGLSYRSVNVAGKNQLAVYLARLSNHTIMFTKAEPCFNRLLIGEGHTFPKGSLTDAGFLFHHFETLMNLRVDIQIGHSKREIQLVTIQDILDLDKNQKVESEGAFLKKVDVKTWSSQLAQILTRLSSFHPITFKFSKMK